MSDRSIYLYNPLLYTQRFERRVREVIARQRGTCAQVRYGEQWILTCRCGALTVTSNMAAPEAFRIDHAPCRCKYQHSEGATMCVECDPEMLWK